MTQATAPAARAGARVAVVLGSRVTLWAAFVAVHLWLGMLALYGPGLPLGDVVYPVGAIVPMLFARALGPELYTSSWLSLVMLLDAVGFAAITGWWASRGRSAVAWWWLGFLVLLGPVAVGRIDSITVPIAIVGVLLVATRPAAAAVVLTLATWIKVWPAALLAAIVVAHRQRRAVVLAAAAASGVVVLVALAFGSGARVFSFITEQTGRGLQVEAPVTTVWLWRAFAGAPATSVYYDQEILTFQVSGPGTGAAAAVMTPVLALAALAVVGVGVWAVARGARADALLPPLALALVATLIAFNKVGSPQFIMWLSVPVVLGLAAHAARRSGSFATPAAIVLVLAGLTQLVYPYFYDGLLSLAPGMLVVVTIRNVLLFVLLAWAVRAVARLVGAATRERENGVSESTPTP
jgi:hypothetical protein